MAFISTKIRNAISEEAQRDATRLTHRIINMHSAGVIRIYGSAPIMVSLNYYPTLQTAYTYTYTYTHIHTYAGDGFEATSEKVRHDFDGPINIRRFIACTSSLTPGTTTTSSSRKPVGFLIISHCAIVSEGGMRRAV